MSRWQKRVGLVAIVVAFSMPFVASAQGEGSIDGQILGPSGKGLRGVTVVLNETGAVEISDGSGSFSFSGVPAGDYSVSYTLGENAETESGVSVTAGEATTLTSNVEWDVSFIETITVFSASRRAERIVEAPAAISVVSQEEIAKEASHGQVPKLIEFTPGAEVTQSGLYDYNVNTRGFNSSLNRRVATIVDGRDPSTPFLASQNWASLAFPLDDVASMEMVRGPSAALYGANASSGVLNLVTKAPRYSNGGLIRATGGEVSTAQLDARWAGEIGNDWYFKLLGSYRDTGDFSVSRVGAAEYSVPCSATQTTDCLPQEGAAVDPLDEVTVGYYSGRLDKYFGDNLVTAEVGTNATDGVVAQTGIGRVQLVEVSADFARVNVSGEHWNFLTYYNKRNADEQRSLTSGLNLVLDTENIAVEAQGNWNLGNDARLVLGASYSEDEVDTLDPATGGQSLTFAPVEGDFTAVFGQVDWSLSDNLKLVVAGRFDDSSLHDSQFSPKGALVWSLNSNHTMRLTYNEAFQVPNYSEFFLAANVALPTDLSGINALVCAPFGLDCGLGVTPILAVGNESLELEEIETIELGYSGILGGNSFLTIDYYNSKSNNFITDLIPQLGTALGRVNENFGPWVAPAGVPDQVADIVRGLVPTLTNIPGGANGIVAVSYANFGEVDSQGIDLGLTSNFADGWTLQFSGSWFDFDIKENLPGFDQLLVPNTPELKFSGGLDYIADRWNASVSARWVDDFRWSVGPFQGDVESYTTVDLNANWDVNDSVTVGINVANLFDDEHFESFGGDLIGRRALGSVTFGW